MHIFHTWTNWEEPTVIESGMLTSLAQRKVCTSCNEVRYRKVKCDDRKIYDDLRRK